MMTQNEESKQGQYLRHIRRTDLVVEQLLQSNSTPLYWLFPGVVFMKVSLWIL